MPFLSSERRFSLLCLTLVTWHQESLLPILWLYLTRASGEEPKGKFGEKKKKEKKVVRKVTDGVNQSIVWGWANQICAATRDAET